MQPADLPALSQIAVQFETIHPFTTGWTPCRAFAQAMLRHRAAR